MNGEAGTITVVAAVARNGVIGVAGGLPWHLPADLKRFKALTMGHPMVMGRRTFESIGRALPGRRTIVVTRDPSWQAPGVEVADSVDSAIGLAVQGQVDGPSEVMVVGGGEIYQQVLPRADRLEITHVDTDVAGDVHFPRIDPSVWGVAARDDRDGYAFVTYLRRHPHRDLKTLLSRLHPRLHDGEFVFCVLAEAQLPPGLRPVVTVREDEGTTAVLPDAEAQALGLTSGFRWRWITLTVTSALDDVGLTAAVSTALARDGIACNIVAGFHHDHLFVPAEQAAAAMSAIEALAHTVV